MAGFLISSIEYLSLRNSVVEKSEIYICLCIVFKEEYISTVIMYYQLIFGDG